MRRGLPGRAETARAAPNARYTPLDVDGPLPLDMIRGMPAMLRTPLGWLERAVARYGDLVAIPLPRTPVLLVNTPTAARRVLQENHRNYTKDTLQYGSLSLVTGAGLLTSDGEPWRQHRRILQPAFHHGGLERVAAQTVASAERLRTLWPADGEPVDADAALIRATLELLGRTVLADDLSAEAQRLIAAVDGGLRAVLARARSPLAIGALAAGPLGRVPTPSRRRLRAARTTLDEVCAAVVARRRAGGIGPLDGDLLAVLLRAGQGLSAEEIRDELVTMVIAGHETVASALTWALHLLASNRQAQDRLDAELDHVLAGRAPNWSDVGALRFTRAVVEETLRLYPPAWVITRRATGADRLDGLELPPGTLVLISPWLLHRRQTAWPDPLRFDPARFLSPDFDPRPAGYLPFGAGPRLCIGRDFALLEAVLVLAALLRDRRVRAPAGSPPPVVDALVTLRPRGGMPLILDER